MFCILNVVSKNEMKEGANLCQLIGERECLRERKKRNKAQPKANKKEVKYRIRARATLPLP